MEQKKILLIEDDNFIREIYQRELEKAGYQIAPAATGVAGLETAKKEKFDLILLDIMLPEMDGFEVLQNLKNDGKTKKTDVIILSNLGQDDLLSKALSIGAKAYIIKSSATPNQILQEVKSVIG